jgi:hypothetical protein
MPTESIRLDISERDLREIYRAVESRRNSVVQGDYGPDNSDWADRLIRILAYLATRLKEEGVS